MRDRDCGLYLMMRRGLSRKSISQSSILNPQFSIFFLSSLGVLGYITNTSVVSLSASSRSSLIYLHHHHYISVPRMRPRTAHGHGRGRYLL